MKIILKISIAIHALNSTVQCTTQGLGNNNTRPCHAIVVFYYPVFLIIYCNIAITKGRHTYLKVLP